MASGGTGAPILASQLPYPHPTSEAQAKANAKWVTQQLNKSAGPGFFHKVFDGVVHNLVDGGVGSPTHNPPSATKTVTGSNTISGAVKNAIGLDNSSGKESDIVRVGEFLVGGIIFAIGVNALFRNAPSKSVKSAVGSLTAERYVGKHRARAPRSYQGKHRKAPKK